MGIIKEKLLVLYKKIRESCFDYRVTVCFVVLATLYETVFIILDNIDNRREVFGNLPIDSFLNHGPDVLRFLLLFILAVMLTENIFPYEKKEQRIRMIRTLCFVLLAVIAAAFVGLQNISDRPVIAAWATRYYIGCILLLILGIVYLCHKRSSVGFIEYIMHVCVNLCVTTAIYFVLCIGFLLVLVVFELLFSGTSVIPECVLILVTGLYYVPGCITALCNMESNIDDEISMVLTKKVLSSMTVCAMAIVYAYLLKILVTWEMPSNEIFGIVSGLFSIGMLIWVVDYYYRDETKYTLFLQRLPYGMIPMIPVQTYAICVRIYNNGMTTSRYAGILFIVFEIIMLLIWRFWREKMERVLIVLCICAVIAVFVPGINMYSLSSRWQKAFLVSGYEKVTSRQEIKQSEYDRMVGAYKYLRWKPEMGAVIEQYDIYDDDFVQMCVISDVNTGDLTKVDSHYIHCCQLVGTIDIDGYSRLNMLNQDLLYDDSAYKKDNGKYAIDFSAFRFYKSGGGDDDSVGSDESIEIDISEFAEKCMEYEKEHPDAKSEEISDAMRPYQVIMIDSDTVLYLNHFEVRYEEGIKDGEEYFRWTTVNISGMLLSR